MQTHYASHPFDVEFDEDEEFDLRPTVPRPAPPALLLQLSTEDFARGWVGRRPSFASHPPALPEPRSNARSPLATVGAIAAILACVLFGTLVGFKLVEQTRPSGGPLASSLLSTVDPSEPKAAEPPRTESASPAPAKVAPEQPANSMPDAQRPPAPEAARAHPAQPVLAPPVAPKTLAAKPEVAIGGPKPAAVSAVVPPKPIEAAPQPEPDPPADPNGGVVSTGF